MKDYTHEFDLFISFTQEDAEFADGYLMPRLRAAGVNCHSEAAFDLGVPRIEAFEDAVRRSRRTVLILSPDYMKDGAARFVEILAQDHASQSGNWPVIPLVLKTVTLPQRLAMLTGLDATQRQRWDKVADRLARQALLALPISGRKPAGLTPLWHESGAQWRRWLWLAVPAALVLTWGGLWLGERRHVGTLGMVRLPAGDFMMGSSDSEVEAALRGCRQALGAACSADLFTREQPLRAVRVAAFQIDATETSNASFAQWLNQAQGLSLDAVQRMWAGEHLLIELDRTHGGLHVTDARLGYQPGYADRPVVGVTWYGASMFCAARGKRLPTEAEWEYAARGSAGRAFPWGDDEPRCGQIVFGAGKKVMDGRDGLCGVFIGGPVARRPLEGPWGLLIRRWHRLHGEIFDRTPEGVWDLGGNVAEWVSDQYQTTSESPPRRVVRGGDWYGPAVFCRAAGRRPQKADAAIDNIGFRCAAPITYQDQ